MKAQVCRPATKCACLRRSIGWRGSDRSSGGTGLGLAVVKGFAEAKGAAVEAANRAEARGARFSVVFPEALLGDVPVAEEVEG